MIKTADVTNTFYTNGEAGIGKGTQLSCSYRITNSHVLTPSTQVVRMLQWSRFIFDWLCIPLFSVHPVVLRRTLNSKFNNGDCPEFNIDEQGKGETFLNIQDSLHRIFPLRERKYSFTGSRIQNPSPQGSDRWTKLRFIVTANVIPIAKSAGAEVRKVASYLAPL